MSHVKPRNLWHFSYLSVDIFKLPLTSSRLLNLIVQFLPFNQKKTNKKETTTNAIHQQSSSSSSSIDWPSFVHPPLSACPVLSCLSILPLFLFSPHLPQPLPTATHPPRKDIVISPSPPPSSSLDSH
ncbi:hypothetical protein PGT21_015585 [Puccinia graminis f. sp. tritici]|uniref:Uncharacterized protein n=1 Tax=Puccinia graminis f. sp. tritici TaxID=56615 RepID=A0A5B0NSG1_PUCGR|nr:hypothetical protein PGT21_013490 [Puccinia graminis f. sp. tritici]KAA1110243.1 hypothetical protein PGT21_015585 [Puccinia graminis f. sp. tritici]